MKTLICTLIATAALVVPSFAEEARKVPAGELDAQALQVQGLTINNINFVIEKAMMGGTKATVQCTVKNKSESDIN